MPRNNPQSEDVTHRMGENIYKPYKRQGHRNT